jgi:hypothetical protein
MRYTKSKDGVERVTVLVPMRFTREELASLRQQARGDTVRDYLSGMLSTELWERHAEEAARREKGFTD